MTPPTTWSGFLEKEYLSFLKQYGVAPAGILVGSKTYKNLVEEVRRTHNMKIVDILYWRGIKVRKANFFVKGLMFLLEGTGMTEEEFPENLEDWTVEERKKG